MWLRSLVGLVLAVLAGCPLPAARPVAPGASVARPPGPAPGDDAPAPGTAVTWARVRTAADVPAAPVPGAFRLHLIDVGTGLALLVQGHDFTLLYDAGTNDRDERPLRVVAYLAAALGASGDDTCVDPGAAAPTTRRRIDHVVLSHPHLDHASALELVLHCYDVGHVWDAGRINEAVFYRELLATIARSAASYHTAADVPADHAVMVKGLAITLPRWQRFSEGDAVELGERARFTFLHADAKARPDPNQNSLVLAVELGARRLLLVGDAESGARRPPSDEPGDVEAFLLDHHAPALRADILQVGHHGSMTSSRRAFLEAVQPSLALVSSGPRRYGTRVLPDAEVIEELGRIGATILRTDEHEGACPVTGRIGGDRGPGGCDSWAITLPP